MACLGSFFFQKKFVLLHRPKGQPFKSRRLSYLVWYSEGMNFQGVIIEESLRDKSVLHDVEIVSTKVEEVTKKHKTPWVEQWTLHTVEIPESSAKGVAEKLSHAIDDTRGSWYADFKTDTHHYVIYPGKVFYIDRSKKGEYDEASQYGVSLGIPEYQVDFSPDIRHWVR